MRFSFFWMGSFLALLGACSEDSDEARATRTLTPDPSTDAGGSGGQSAAGSANEPGPSASAGASSSSEMVDVTGPLDTSKDEDESEGSSGDTGGSPTIVADAGAPPATGAVCPAGPFPADPLAGAAAPQMVCTNLAFTEGAVWFAERNTLFFSDIVFNNPASGSIMSFSPGGTCEVFIANAGTNGLVIAPDGNLLGARHSDGTLTLFNLETRQGTVFVADNAGAAFISPNDIAVRSDGNIYFTDPDYGLGGGMAAQPPRAYHRALNGTLTVIDEQGNSNGITLSPDESLLYLSHLGSQQDNVLVFDVDASGAPVNPRPFIANVGSDGMGIDCAGNLYITQQGSVRVFAPDGSQIGTIPAPQAANVAFGGPDRRTLFITAGTNLLSVQLAIPGLPY